VNLLPTLGDTDYYQELLPQTIRLILPRGSTAAAGGE